MTPAPAIAAAKAPLRRGRGLAFAGAALTLAVCAHVLGGGELPDPVTLVFLGVPLGWVSFFLTRGRRRWPVVIGALIAVQAGLHEGLSLLSGQMTGPFAAGPGGHEMIGVAGRAAAGLPTVDPAAQMPLVPSLGMLAAHLLSTVLTGAVLAYGEHLVWSIWAWLRRAVTVLAPPVRVPAARRAAVSWFLTANPVPRQVDRGVRRRGPPAPKRSVLPAAC